LCVVNQYMIDFQAVMDEVKGKQEGRQTMREDKKAEDEKNEETTIIEKAWNAESRRKMH